MHRSTVGVTVRAKEACESRSYSSILALCDRSRPLPLPCVQGKDEKASARRAAFRGHIRPEHLDTKRGSETICAGREKVSPNGAVRPNDPYERATAACRNRTRIPL